MKKFLVRIRSVQEAKEFVQICEQIKGDVNVSNGKREVDGKSIMGILSLDLAIPLHVEVISDTEISDIMFGNLEEKIR